MITKIAHSRGVMFASWEVDRTIGGHIWLFFYVHAGNSTQTAATSAKMAAPASTSPRLGRVLGGWGSNPCRLVPGEMDTSTSRAMRLPVSGL
jgi:hypothetical protein